MDLKFEDLWAQCDRCKGSGNFRASAIAAGSSRSGPAFCTSCQGDKGRPTKAGEAIIALFNKMNEVAELRRSRADVAIMRELLG
jgi:hypothetical protein